MLNKLHQEVSIAKASLIKIPPVWFTLQTVFIMCITNSHQAPAMGPGGGPSKEAVLFVWHLRHQSTSEDHRMSASYKSKTKSSPSPILGRSARPFQGDAVEFQNNSSFGPWNSVETSEASETSEAGLHLPLPLFANPVGSLADSYLSESLSRCRRQPTSKRRKARHLPVKRLRSHIVRQGTCDGFSTGSGHTFLGHKVM